MSVLKEGISKANTSAESFVELPKGGFVRDDNEGKLGDEWDRWEKEEVEGSSTAEAMIAVPLIAWPAAAVPG